MNHTQQRQASSVKRPASSHEIVTICCCRRPSRLDGTQSDSQNAVSHARAGCERQRACSTSQAARCWRWLAVAMDHDWLLKTARSSLLLRMLQALQVRSSQELAIAVSVMGFDYSHGRRPPSDPQCIPVASLRRVTACVSPCYAQNVTLLQVCAAVRSPASAATRPPIGLRERRARRFIRHHPAHSAERLLTAVLRCHHPWDTIMTRQKR